MIKFINFRQSGKKGFTLMEVIISLAVFAIFSLVIAVMFELMFKLKMNTNDIDNQMDSQISTLDNGATEVYDNTKTFQIKFNDVTDSITASGEKVASGATDDRIPIRVFE